MKKATKKKLMGESEFQREILKAFKDDPNITFYRRNVGGMENKNGDYVCFGEAGQSDIWGIIAVYRCPFCNRPQEGVHVEIELKSATGTLTAKQKKWIETVKAYFRFACFLSPSIITLRQGAGFFTHTVSRGGAGAARSLQSTAPFLTNERSKEFIDVQEANEHVL